MNKPKILLALSRFPYPDIDGTRYKILHNVSDGLKAEFDIEYFIVTFNKVSEEQVRHVEKEFGKVHLFRISFVSFLFHSLASFFTGLPFQTSGFFIGRAQRFIKNHMHEYDAVYVHTVRMAEYFTKLPKETKEKVLIEFNDAISFNYKDAKKEVPLWLKVTYWVEETRVRSYEKKLLETFSFFNVISPYDREYLLGLITRERSQEVNFECIPHGMDDGLVKQRTEVSDKTCYFVGQLDYAPNRDSVQFFLKNFWVQIKKEVPDARFIVIGKANKESYESYKSLPGVSFLGFVPDVYEAVKNCACLVAPIRFGAGMPSKIIEAMAYGIPVVTTPVGVRGIAGTENKLNAVVINEHNHKEWIESVVSLLNGGEVFSQIGEHAQKLIQEKYTRSKVQEQWREIFRNIIIKK
jgi:glycosyltransferase involved in cell wall biosynthesis